MLYSDLEGLVPATDFQEIRAEQQLAFQVAFDKLYAEKILTRAKAQGRKNPKQKGKATKGKPFNKGGKKGKGPRPGPSSKPKQNPKTNKSAAMKGNLSKMLADLTKAVKNMK